MTAASQQPFSIADLIEASKKRHNVRRGSSSRRRSDSDSFSAAEDEDDVKPMDHYNRVVLSLLSPLFGALDALESLRIESRTKGTSTDRHAEDLSSNDISIESNGTVADLSDVNVMNGIATTPTGSIVADQNESSPGSFSPMATSGTASTTSGTRVAFGTTVQRAVSQNAIEPAVDLIMGHLQDIPQYDQKLQFLGKLVRTHANIVRRIARAHTSTTMGTQWHVLTAFSLCLARTPETGERKVRCDQSSDDIAVGLFHHPLHGEHQRVPRMSEGAMEPRYETQLPAVCALRG